LHALISLMPKRATSTCRRFPPERKKRAKKAFPRQFSCSYLSFHPGV